MNSQRTLEMFKQHGAIMQGHFLLTSGLHSSMYVEKFRVFEHPEATAELCEGLAEVFRSLKVETVVGPVTGGIILAHETAKQLGVRCVFPERAAPGEPPASPAKRGERSSERESGAAQGMTLRRGFQIKPKERVVIVEDILTTGRSIREILAVLGERGAEVVGIGVLVDRSGGKVEFDAPLHALARLDIATYPPETCPLCQKGMPVVKPGSRTVPA